MHLTVAVCEIQSRRAFRIARARRPGPLRTVFVRLEHEGIVGYGEASPSSYYGETAEDVAARLRAFSQHAAALRPPENRADLAALWAEAWLALRPSRAAQCALDLALWDWLARQLGVSVGRLVGNAEPQPVTTFCTLGLSTAEELPEKLAELARFPRLKVKSDAAADLAVLRRVVASGSREVIALDANASWRPEQFPPLAEELARLSVTFIEQPLSPSEDQRLVAGTIPLPVLADESCVVEADVSRLATHFDGFNVKLVKCGGLTPALRMVSEAKALGRKVMIGCMLESSLLIAAGSVAAQAADYADLDGAWLLADDPFRGWEFREGILHPPVDQPGFGATPVAPIFAE